METRLQKLRNRARALLVRLQELKDAAVGEDKEPRAFTEDEQREWDDGFADLDKMEIQIKQEERLASVTQPPAASNGDGGNANANGDDGSGAGAGLGDGDGDELRFEVGTDRWVKRGFGSLGEQLQAIAVASQPSTPQEDHDRRLRHVEMEHRVASGLSETVPSDGGFLLQKDFITAIRDRMHEQGQILSGVRKTPIAAGSTGLKFNVINETSRVDGSRAGGVRAYWTDEADAFTKSKPKLRQVELTLSKLTALMYATGELLADAPALTERANRDFGDELLFKTEDAIWEGDGSGKPLGILGHDGTININKESGQVANTIVPENIVKMYSRARNRQNGAWYINQDIEPQLWLMSLAVGTGGGPVFMPAGGLSGAPFATLLGRPVIAVEFASTLGTSGDIVFADWDAYEFIDKGSPQFDSSIHVRFLNDEETFRAIYRVDGQPLHDAKLTPFKGSTTTAHFITLQTRS